MKLTAQEKRNQINDLNNQMIYVGGLTDFIHECDKRGANEKIRVLSEILLSEANKHNGSLRKKITKLQNTGTID